MESGSFPIIANISQALGSRGLFITFSSIPKGSDKWYIDVPSTSSSSYSSNLQAYQNAQQSVPQNIDTAQNNVKSSEFSLIQKQNALVDAKELVSDYYVSAPFDGIMGSITANLGETTSDVLGTIITNQKLASISLNEVDVAKIKLGQKVTLTFDAIPDLSVAGEVASIDAVGAVSSGVVSYNVKISFASENDSIKPGMSVSASIITKVAQDVMTLPNGSIKTKNGATYVEIFNQPLETPPVGVAGSLSATLPKQQTVEVGISNDTTSEITSGLKEGDIVVSKTITTTVSTSATSSAPSLLGSGRGSVGGDAVRNAGGR